MKLGPLAISDETILSNANVLQTFDPSIQSLEIDDDGKMRLNPISLIEMMSNGRNPEKSIILWHWGQLKSAIQRQAAKIAAKPITHLQSFYEASNIWLGLIKLSSEMVNTLKHLHKQLNILEGTDAPFSLEELDYLLRDLKNRRKLQLKTIFIFTIVSSQIIDLISLRAPLTFPISGNELSQPCQQVKAQFVTNMGTLKGSKPYPDKVQFRFMGAQVDVVAYPSFHSGSYHDVTEQEINNGIFSAQYWVQTFVAQRSSGVIPYTPVHLLGTMTFSQSMPVSFSIIPPHKLIRQFQLLIEIATVQGYSQVIFFAPYHFSSRAYSMGFYSRDKNLPSLAEQQDVVTKMFAVKKMWIWTMVSILPIQKQEN